jgi:hypothetical protein
LRQAWALAVPASVATVIIAAASAASSPKIPMRMMMLQVRFVVGQTMLNRPKHVIVASFHYQPVAKILPI